MADLDRSNVVILLFTLQGCGHCEAFKPVIAQLMPYYPGIPLIVIDVSNQDPEVQRQADRFGIQAFPTTVVARRGMGYVALEGQFSVADAQREIFERAARVQRGDVLR